MKWQIKREIFALIIIACFLILAAVFYPSFPQKVPSHFDMKGMPDGYSSKTFFLWMNLGIPIFLYFLLTFIPMIDPFWKKIQSKYSIFLFFRDLALLFFLFFFVLTIYAVKAGRLPTYLFGLGFGLLFILMGNYLPKLPRNFFFGIRVPWTLASDTVWNKTHRLGGWAFVLGGFVAIILSLFRLNSLLVLGVSLGPVLLIVCLIYPLWLYKKLEKEGQLKSPNL